MTDYSKYTDSEIDRLVAERVREWHLEARAVGQEGWCNAEGKWQIDIRDWRPSTDLNQAWEAADEFCKTTWSWSLVYDHLDNERRASVYKIGDDGLPIIHTCKVGLTDTNTPARAICEALLQAEEEKEDRDELDPFDRKYESD